MRVIIVGAGAIGLMSALHLAERGASVLVVESEPAQTLPTRTASRVAAGMLGPLSETLVERETAHPRLLELGVASLTLWRERGPQLSPATFPPRGARLIGYSSAQIGALAARAKMIGLALKETGAGVEVPDEAAIDPSVALDALMRAITERGGEVRYGANVIDVARGRVSIAGGGTETADEIVLATGAWTNTIIPAPPITPTKGQIIEVRSSVLAPGETARSPGAYAVGRARGSVVIGATVEPGRTDLTTDPATIESLRATASALDPSLARADVIRAWAGVRPMSADWAPRIGRVGDVIVARGHSRNGWLLAPITAEMVAAHIFAEALPPLWMEFTP